MKFLKRGDASYTYMLDLPEEIYKRHIHLMFHIRLLHQYEENDNLLISEIDAPVFYNVGQSVKEEWLVNEIIAH